MGSPSERLITLILHLSSKVYFNRVVKAIKSLQDKINITSYNAFFFLCVCSVTCMDILFWKPTLNKPNLVVVSVQHASLFLQHSLA